MWYYRVTQCPQCGEDLTQTDSVRFTATRRGFKPTPHLTRLNDRGSLQDVELLLADDCVADQSVICTSCEYQLAQQRLWRMEFIIAAVSGNSNSFGLYQHVAIARNGLAVSFLANQLRKLKQGDRVVFKIPKFNFAELGYELGGQIETPPTDLMLVELWKDKALCLANRTSKPLPRNVYQMMARWAGEAKRLLEEGHLDAVKTQLTMLQQQACEEALKLQEAQQAAERPAEPVTPTGARPLRRRKAPTNQA